MENKRVFLLGGKDLEMNEIEKILSSKNEKFENKNLSWGAKLSFYKEELEKYKNDESITIYGIELEKDIEISNDYIEIDHHGKNDDKPSSLEQIAKILNINLTKEQKLIAANDSRYICGMKNLCATQDKIENIRKLDRKIQGVTQEDEELAKESINSSQDRYIYSKTSYFSAISDEVYFKFPNYVIYNDDKILFYGYKKQNILDFLKEQKNISEKDFYYGGGEFGFVGIKDKILQKEEIETLIEEFKEFENKEDIYSYHTFMFPFIFEGDFYKKDNWKYKAFEVEEQKNYNEFVYFYKHVQDAIYNKEEKDDSISNYYEYKEQKGTYTICCKKGKFELELDGLSLRIFNTKVAILTFNLKNTKYSDLDSVLAINDFGRRIYPQFLGKNFTCDTKNTILSNCITLTLNGEEIKEDFTRFDNKKDLDNQSKKLLPNFIHRLIKDNFRNKKDCDKEKYKGTCKYRPIIDDRMFAISLYMNDALVSELKTFKDDKNEYEYEANDFWYKYVFVDGDYKTCQSKHMTKKLISQSTYDRWIEEGTLFGISRYSFVSITGSWFGKNRLLPHMQTMYFQIFSLLLAYRASIIKFSDDIQNITQKPEEILVKEADELYERYLKFINKLYFKEITAQDQGIELYNQAMKVMDIEKYMNDLNHEINQLHSYVSMKEEKIRNEKLDFISKIGAVLLPPSLLAGIFGMNVLTFDETLWNETLAILLIVLSGFIGYSFIDGNKENDKTNNPVNKIVSTLSKFKIEIICIFISILIVFSIFSDKKDDDEEIKIKNQPIEVIISDKKEKNE
ncbi:CorA family divalent cation transporter [Aliarcobacter butzleri]|uniref:CorA family divalent cation transporter n=1 Tax=Aliarcobacter butzleri TaxID=28197 RepID=UPI0021B2BA7D|nr:CorA family divalent cation transporter [Aliarcobacter butzleri]MCT7586798.1 CorA family divalent cation transporter [Aliarcobacter butzleri]